MAIVDEKTIASKDGIKKGIDKKSMGMALDILQRGLYSFPIKSTIRELASNAHDAVRERDVAVGIINGKEKIEDHYDTTKGEEGIYHSSGFDPDYFKLNWLSDDPYVKIYYEEGDLRDVIRIVDNGVGLGKDRLLGYFTLQYSSKRTNKDTLGRFGLGSKVALSLGVESFRVISRYNGMKYKFDVYLDKIESVIPKFGPNGMNHGTLLTQDKTDEDGNFTPAYEAYWEDTTEKNGVEVQIQVKKHNKNAFFEAIESQLMYMPNILFLHRERDGITHSPIDIKAKIEYRDENIIISKSTVYNKPHILLGTGDVLINYGFLAFNELEIESKGGAVGLIMDINDIEVTPSREAPVWSTKTRAAVLKKYDEVTATATAYVNKEIKAETDYLGWMQKAHSILSSIQGKGSYKNEGSVLSTLASIIDVSKIDTVEFAPDPSILLKDDIKEMFGDKFMVRTISWDSWNKKINRTNAKGLGALTNPLYIANKPVNKYKDRYINEEIGAFTIITAKEDHDKFERSSLIMKSTITKDYDSITVPEDRLALYLSEGNDDEEDDDDDLTKISTKSRAELRKENKEIVVHEAYKNYNSQWIFSANDIKVSEIFKVKPNHTVMYGTGNDRNALKTILTILPTFYTRSKIDSSFFDAQEGDTKLTSVLVAKENLKYINSSNRFNTIVEVVTDFYDDNTEHLTLSSKMKYTITAELIYSFLSSKYKDKLSPRLPDVLYQWTKVDKIHRLVSDGNPKKEKTSNYIREVVNHVHSSTGNLAEKDNFGFFVNLGKLHLVDAGLLEVSDEDKEKLIDKINRELPEYLCDDIDEISTVDAVYVDLFNDAIEMLSNVMNGWNLVSLFSGKYYYNDDELNLTLEDIKLFLKYKNNDASIQQQNNT